MYLLCREGNSPHSPLKNEAIPLRTCQEDWTQRLPASASRVRGPSDRIWAWVLREPQEEYLLLFPLEQGSIRVKIWDEQSH